MSVGYQPYLISDLKHGLELGIKPWLIPQDAFSSMKNAFLYRGVLEKRLGHTQFDRFVHFIDDEAVGASGTDNYTGTLDNIPVRDAEFTDGTLTISVDSSGTITGDGTGTFNNTTGVFDITFSGNTTDAVTVDYNYYPGNAIVGIENYYTNAGVQELLIFDTKRCGKYNETTEEIDDLTQTDVWGGSQDNFIWAENWKDRLFVTNNQARPYSYDGTSFTALMMDIDDDATNEVTTVLMFFSYKERLVALRTTEDGVSYQQRARWCKAGDPDTWDESDGGGYVDAPTLDWIMAADFIGDDLIVWFERSVWRLKYTGNSTLPFRWEQIAATDGSYSTFGTFSFSDEVVTIGSTSIVATDGLDAYSIDKKVPDIVLDIDQSLFDNTFAVVIEENNQVLISYPTIGQTENNETICLNYEGNSWSKFDFGFNCYGYFSEANELTIDDIDDAFDDLEITFDARTNQVGFPTTLAGDTSGYIWKINDGGADNGSDIEFEVICGRWNPFIKDGRMGRLGWVDFLVERDPGISFNVDFYVDQEPVAHTTETVTCDSDSDTEEKIWKRAYCDARDCHGPAHLGCVHTQGSA